MATEKSPTHDRELFITRKVNAPVELVWEVWTKPEHIAKWWGPNGFTNTIETMDMVPGGSWDLVMHGPDGTDYVNRSIFREVIPLKKIVYEHISYPHILATIEFEAQEEETLINWHMLFDSPEVFADVVRANQAAEGLKQNVEKLNVYVQNFKASRQS